MQRRSGNKVGTVEEFKSCPRGLVLVQILMILTVTTAINHPPNVRHSPKEL